MAASQTLVSFVPHAVPAVHEGLHVWSPGQHAGAAAPQSVFERHAPHEPRMQKGEPAPQSVSATHSTQPSEASHFLFPHAVAAFAVQAAPPGIPSPGPVDEEPPQAATTIRTNPATPRQSPMREDLAMRSAPLRTGLMDRYPDGGITRQRASSKSNTTLHAGLAEYG